MGSEGEERAQRDGECLDAEKTAAYLARLGIARAAAAGIEGLRRLHRAHQERVPFENLDIRAGRPLSLESADLFDKIVARRRGGFCYELNGLFALLLRSLGFDVTLLAARVAREDRTFGPEFDHLALEVAQDGPWLLDVGFGDGFALPLRIIADREQMEADRSFRFVEESACWILEERRGGDTWRAAYAFTRTPRRLADFAGMFRFHQTSPESHFTRNTICTAKRLDGRVTLSGNLLIRTRDGVRTEREIGEDERVTILEREFGIVGVGFHRNDEKNGRDQPSAFELPPGSATSV